MAVEVREVCDQRLHNRVTAHRDRLLRSCRRRAGQEGERGEQRRRRADHVLLTPPPVPMPRLPLRSAATRRLAPASTFPEASTASTRTRAAVLRSLTVNCERRAGSCAATRELSLMT